jgi:hypothetical protein
VREREKEREGARVRGCEGGRQRGGGTERGGGREEGGRDKGDSEKGGYTDGESERREGGREGGRGGRGNPKDADGRLLHVPIQTQPEDCDVDYLALAQIRQVPYMFVCLAVCKCSLNDMDSQNIHMHKAHYDEL